MILSITAAELIPSDGATLIQGTTGVASITRGMAVYSTGNNVYRPASNGDTDAAALAVGIAMVDSSPGQPTVICTADPEMTFGATTLPETLVGQVISLGYYAGNLVTHDEVVDSGLKVKVIGLVIAEGKMQFNLQGLVPAFTSYVP